MKNKATPAPVIDLTGDWGTKIVRACTVRRPAGELYAFWRDLRNLPRIIRHPVTITTASDLESHWEVTAPFGREPVAWDADIINDEPGRLIVWRSQPGADIPNAGSVRFNPAPGDEGTEVVVKLEYQTTSGRLGQLLAKLTGDEPGQQVADALRQFKALMEGAANPAAAGPV